MILNIVKGLFGDTLRNGDLVAVGNVLEYLRIRDKNPELKFYMKPDTLSPASYVQQFFFWLTENTDWFSLTPGDKFLDWKHCNVWDFRDISGDLVKIVNYRSVEKKVVIFPVLDAPYNAWRNWPQEVFQQIVNEYGGEKYKDYRKIICITPNIKISVNGWEISTDFMTNIDHILTADTYVGGDTGTSHFAWALDRSPPNLVYWSSSRGLVHTLPFYSLRGKGQINSYWLNFEGPWTKIDV